MALIESEPLQGNPGSCSALQTLERLILHLKSMAITYSLSCGPDVASKNFLFSIEISRAPHVRPRANCHVLDTTDTCPDGTAFR